MGAQMRPWKPVGWASNTGAPPPPPHSCTTRSTPFAANACEAGSNGTAGERRSSATAVEIGPGRQTARARHRSDLDDSGDRQRTVDVREGRGRTVRYLAADLVRDARSVDRQD